MRAMAAMTAVLNFMLTMQEAFVKEKRGSRTVWVLFY